MQKARYEPLGEHGIGGRRVFTKGGEEHRTHNAPVFQAGSPDIARRLDFRDYLRTHPAAAEEYAQLKSPLARQFGNDVTVYDAKFKVLFESVEHYIKEEEKQLFPEAKKKMAEDLDHRGEQMEQIEKQIEG